MTALTETEIKENQELQDGYQEIPETPEIPVHVEQGGVNVAQTQFSAQVNDDQGKPLIQTPKIPSISIQTPADQTNLEVWSKGPITESLTWFAVFWLRLIKKASLKGWNVITGGQK